MAKFHHRNNNIGSILLDCHHHNNTTSNGGGGHFKLWSAFSGAAFRRKLFDTIGCGVSRQHCEEEEEEDHHHNQQQEHEQEEAVTASSSSSLKLSEILKYSEAGIEMEETEEKEEEEENDETTAKRKLLAFEELQRVVKRLQDDCGGERQAAALDVRRLAKDDSFARETLAMLGAIPPLVAMLDSIYHHEHMDYQIASLYALLNLSIGNDLNKAAIVKAGAVHKMLKLIDHNSNHQDLRDAIVVNFLSLTALDSNKPIIATSGAIPFLYRTLQIHKNCYQAKQDALKAIYNLSIFPSNTPIILETDLVPFLLNTLGDMEVSQIILSILSNLVSGTPQGRRAVVNSPQAFPILIDALNWIDSPGCQEKASYVLMVVAHKGNYGDRQAMVEAGIVSSLLELTLIGSTLAQKRASRILECLRLQVDNKGKQICSDSGLTGGGAVSAPICCSSMPKPEEQGQHNNNNNDEDKSKQQEDDEEEEMRSMSEEKKAVKQLVQQSLQSNMRRIVKRANLPREFVPSEHFKSLTMTSTSKSLPF